MRCHGLSPKPVVARELRDGVCNLNGSTTESGDSPGPDDVRSPTIAYATYLGASPGPGSASSAAPRYSFPTAQTRKAT